MIATYCGALYALEGKLYVVRTGGPTAGEVCPVDHGVGETCVMEPIGQIRIWREAADITVFSLDDLTLLVSES